MTDIEIARFPRTRPDGTLSVAIRYAAPSSDELIDVEQAISDWVREKMERDHVDVLDDLLVLPRVDSTGGNTMEIVFDGRAGSRRWKDWMVSLHEVLEAAQPGLRFECFFDRVAGEPHPASLHERGGTDEEP